MKIGLVVERFESHGGVEQVVWQTAGALARAGDEVHVFARAGEERREVEFHRIRTPSFWQPLRVLEFARRSARSTSRVELDVVHAFCRAPGHDVFHAGGGSHASYMLRTYGSTGAAARRFSPRHAMQLTLERRVLAESHTAIQCVSSLVARELSAIGVPDERLHAIPNGVDAQRFAPLEDATLRRGIRGSLGAGDGDAWLFVGSGWRRKGADLALRALAASSDPHSELWMVGRDDPTPWRAFAAELGVDKRVRFLGERSDPERLYAAADALLLPSRYDAFALVVLEAAASGIPVVTTATTGASEWIAPDAGFAIDHAEDVEGLAAALDALSDRSLRARMGAAGRRIAEGLSWSRQIERLRALYAAQAEARKRNAT